MASSSPLDAAAAAAAAEEERDETAGQLLSSTLCFGFFDTARASSTSEASSLSPLDEAFFDLSAAFFILSAGSETSTFFDFFAER
jgi:hypothetical protein